MSYQGKKSYFRRSEPTEHVTKPGEWGIIKPSAVEHGGVKGTSLVNRPRNGEREGREINEWNKW